LRSSSACVAALDDVTAFIDQDHVRCEDGRQPVAIAIVVRPCITRSSAACTRRSLTVSSADVASSRIRIRGFFSRTRAIAMRCFSPPDSR
jgi:hypothetical protein